MKPIKGNLDDFDFDIHMNKDKFGASSGNIMVEAKVSLNAEDDKEVILTAPVKNASFLMKLGTKTFTPPDAPKLSED